jgi:hypothetical protein
VLQASKASTGSDGARVPGTGTNKKNTPETKEPKKRPTIIKQRHAHFLPVSFSFVPTKDFITDFD